MNAVPPIRMNLKQLETKMNKIALSLVALAAISTASFAAGNRSWELRDAPTYMGQFAAETTAVTSTNAIAVIGSSSAPTLAEINKRNMEKNASSSH